MNDSSTYSPEVLIRTLPLRHGNYGGVLQGYALAEALSYIGQDVATDVSVRPTRASQAVSTVLPTMTRISTAPVFKREINEIVQATLNNFVDQRIRSVNLFTSRSPDGQVMRNVRTVIIGGDQVWREAYGDVGSYLLDFLPSDSPARRISYAASFGARVEKDLSRLRRFKPLAQRFDLVSVREDWAVDTCAEIWGVEAKQVVDPVLLLQAEHYRHLGEEAASSRLVDQFVGDGQVFGFILDPTDSKIEAIRSIGKRHGKPVSIYTPPPTPSFLAYHRGRPSAARLTLQEWILSVAEASLVVTDSYHGVVLAVLLNTPFVPLANPARGMGRFQSLFRLIGRHESLRVSEREYATSPVELSWARVNHALMNAREDSARFLRQALA